MVKRHVIMVLIHVSMLNYQILKLGRQTRFYLPQLILCHTEMCPTRQIKPICPSSSTGGSKGRITPTAPFKRAMYSAKVRLGFIPDEWFLFFHSKTGVSGPYIFGIVLANYLVSKEIFILEHEYYTGLSVLIMIYYATKKFGPDIAKSLDKEVDAYVSQCENSRKTEIIQYESIIKNAKDAQMRAEAQKVLMDAKKENIAMQLEAIHRERLMHVYSSVKNRLDYQVRLQIIQVRIQQKWMIEWILENVQKSITPEFEQQVLNKAIQDIASIAKRT